MTFGAPWFPESDWFGCSVCGIPVFGKGGQHRSDTALLATSPGFAVAFQSRKRIILLYRNTNPISGQEA